MAADAWVIHDKFKEYLGDGTIDMDLHDFRMALHTATSTVATTAENSWTTFAGVKAEVTNANGYVTGGELLVLPTWTENLGTVTFSCNDVMWTANTAGITAHYACIYNDSVTNPVDKPIVCHSLLDNGGGGTDVTATAGNTFTVQINVNGVFTLA